MRTYKRFCVYQINKKYLIWDAVLSALFAAGGLLSLSIPLGKNAPSWLPVAAAAVITWLLFTATSFLKSSTLKVVLRVVYFASSVLLCKTDEIWRGLRFWFNCFITSWNTAHDSALPLFDVQATARSVISVSVVAAMGIAVLVYYFVKNRQIPVCAITALAFLAVELACGTVSEWSCVLYMIAFAGLWSAFPGMFPSAQALRFTSLCAAILCLCAAFAPTKQLDTVTNFRNTVKHDIDTVRYGENDFPKGELAQAGILGSSPDTALSLRTEHEKALYLRGFVGAEYSEGSWQRLPDSAYGGEYSGMLKWLSENGFDPLTQVFDYYTLCGDAAPEENHIEITAGAAPRCYIYAPASLGSVGGVGHSDLRDSRLSPKGIFGAKSYTVTEISSAKPAELCVRADWVADPDTPERLRYSESEAVYREFVYDSYTDVTSGLEDSVHRMFWEDYTSENDTIFGAVCRIRDVLESSVSFTSSPEAADGADPLASFLSGKTGGNSVMYASAAVEALRAYGIPARYVEGYYASAADVAASKDGNLTLGGESAHAWAEVYFDGIGFLPIEFTYGYYFDTVTLQKMVAAPDTAKKTAAVSNEGDSVGDIADKTDKSDASKQHPLDTVKNISLLLLGAFALAAVIITAITLLCEILRMIHNAARMHRYKKAPPIKRTQMLCDEIFTILSLQGIESRLGWRVAETDKLMTDRFPAIQPGDYTRAVQIMEKAIYGGAAPDGFEIRILESFSEKITYVPHPVFNPKFWRLRYGQVLRLGII